MQRICIIGAGELGGSIAHALLAGGRVDDILLVDDDSNVASGKALDLRQAGAIERFHSAITGTNDTDRVTGCTVCVIADRSGRPSKEWQGEEGLAMLTRLTPRLGKAPLVFAGASQTGLLLAGSRDLHMPRGRLVGSSPEAFAAAVKSMVAIEARCSPEEIGLAVLGLPPRGLVIPWSEASIGGYLIERVLTQVQLSRIEARISRLWPQGPYSLGLAAARVAEAIVGSSPRTFSLVTVLDGEFGVRGKIGVLPATLSTSGIASTRVPTLNTRERVQVDNVLEA